MGGVDLGKMIPSVLLGFFILAALTMGFTDMGSMSGLPITDTSVFSFNNSLNAARNIENKTASSGPSAAISSFFPGAGLLFSTWDILKSSTTGVMLDMKNAINRFFVIIADLGGGSLLLLNLKDIIITIIAISVTFVILAALFRAGGFKQQ